eukprot:TRINITY_DN5537_c0_g1_i6.p1 TRINITY_DN5537_c0_g1~~TRINITY_DN5537_c0_g1_i6.p1  ORF type:complete len:100 (-),score=17.91 TRINITY_DN5537_c0_g1_i6:161-460(-)
MENTLIQHDSNTNNDHLTQAMKALQRGIELSKPCVVTSAKKFERAMYAYHDKINSIVPKLFEWQDLASIGETIRMRVRAHYQSRQNSIEYKEMPKAATH